MPWTLTENAEEYAQRVEAFLVSDPIRHTIGAVGIQSWREGHVSDASIFGWWTNSDGVVTDAASMTPPWSLLIEAVAEERLPSLVEALDGAGAELPGVHGEVGSAAAFAAMWRATRGVNVELGMVIRLFALGDLKPPRHRVAGFARRVAEDDLSLATEWMQAFADELGDPNDDPAEEIRRRARRGAVWFWCDADGSPVSMAGNTAPAAGVARVGPVYTPVELRGRGYAEAATHSACRGLADEGITAVLFADQANPTSTGIYRALGFAPVSDRAVLLFSTQSFST
jgi:hypothetical protein